MVMKNNLIGKFNCNKNGVKIKMLNNPRAGVRIRKIKRMVKDPIKVFPSKNHSRVKMMKKMRSRTKTSPIRIHYQIRMTRDNPDKVHFKRSKVEQGGARWSKVEKNENRVCKKRDLVNNYKNIEMVNR